MKAILAWLLAVLGAYAQGALAAQITPLELLRRPLLKSPIFTSANSKNNQFSGLTTLASGSVSQVVSTSMATSGALFSLTPWVALPAAYVTQGRTSPQPSNSAC